MNKNAIQRFAIWARTELISQVSQRAYQYDITADGYGDYNSEAVAGRLLSEDEKKQRQQLINQIRSKGYAQVMEEVAYTWFNRFIALRFMEVNNYLPTHIRVFSDASGAFKPEILSEALHLDLQGLDMEKVSNLIEKNQTEDLYRYLLLTQCNALSVSLPRMFEKMGSYTELLLPNNILRQDGVLGRMVTDIPEEDWTDQVQIIGWLYQYYNTELKSETFALLKKKVKITKERIPSATQLFTPDWIVRYMVENSLGRLWIEGHPDDELKAEWKYYLDEAEQETDVQAQLETIRAEYRALRPQDIKVIDPCMGSGHILVYAFDVLVQIYKRAGFSERDAAKSILENNLYGLDIDERAAQLAYFAVMMKARQYDRRILSRDIQPQIYGPGIDPEIREYGSLLLVDKVPEAARDGQLSFMDESDSYKRLLAQKYHVVVTNPPYMGAGNMNNRLATYIKKNYPDEKSDLFACFINKGNSMAKPEGFNCMVTMQSWMFLSSFETMRTKIIASRTIANLMHMENMVLGIAFGTAVTVFKNDQVKGYKGTYNQIRLCDIESGVPKTFPIPGNHFAQISTENFSKISGSPVAYWASSKVFSIFEKSTSLGEKFTLLAGTSTGDNDKYQRFWAEVPYCNISREAPGVVEKRWFPCNTGGEFRKYAQNDAFVIDWEHDGYRIKNQINSRGKIGSAVRNRKYFFRAGLTWNKLSSSNFGVRILPKGYISDDTARVISVEDDEERYVLLGFLCSSVCKHFLQILSPTMSFTNSELQRIPIPQKLNTEDVIKLTRENLILSKESVDSYETSWDFKRHPLVGRQGGKIYRSWNHEGKIVCRGDKIPWNYLVETSYQSWEDECENRFQTLKINEKELNRIFIDAYGLQDELTPEVEDKDVTVRRAELGRDIRSLISYAVGCMFGRYSLDVPGLVYAGGEWDDRKYNSFIPDPDNIIPICDDDYFDDDITGRFVKWMEVVFGKETLEENLKFIADALGSKGTPREVIRNYFLNGFYADHLKTYQKRPIYWLFDSGKKNGFKALIYMHRYQSDLLARMRTDYVHEQQERYRTQLGHIGDAMNSASASERVKLAKQQKKLQEQALELQKYEEKVHHLADQNIKIDLDDGVKYNYALFETVLAKIK